MQFLPPAADVDSPELRYQGGWHPARGRLDIHKRLHKSTNSIGILVDLASTLSNSLACFRCAGGPLIRLAVRAPTEASEQVLAAVLELAPSGVERRLANRGWAAVLLRQEDYDASYG